MKAPFSKLRRNRKGGVSVVIATIMAVFVLMMAVSQIYLYQNTLTSQTQSTLAEKFTLTNLFVNTTDSKTYFTLTNTGTVEIEFIAIWVNYSRTPFKELLNPTEANMTGLNLKTVINDTFTFQVETSRGNRIIQTYSPLPENAPPDVQATGVFKMSWFYCQYTSSKQRTKSDLLNLSIATSGDKYVVVYLQLTNNWIYPTTIKAQSFLTFLIYSTDPEFYVVNGATYPSGTTTCTDTNTKLTQFTEIVVQPQQTITLAFGAQAPSSTTWNWGSSFPSSVIGTGEGANMLVSVFYTLNGYSAKTFGETLTAQAVRLNSGS